MASPQVTLQALGLNYSPNNLSLPPGSLVQADNVIIRRDNVVESRRGFLDYSETFGNSEDYAKQLIEYKDRILLHYSNKLSFDTSELNDDGKAIFNNFSGTYSETQSGLRIKSIEANKNLYFTTSDGIKKISAKTASDFTTNGVYTFKVVSANASVGAVYTNNDAKFTVTTSISGETILRTSGNSNPDSFGVLTKVSGIGDLSIGYSSYALTSKFIRSAGAIKALDITGRLNAIQGDSGFLPNDSAVAYRAVWGYKDVNDNLLLGVPSNRIEIYNYLVDTIAMDLNTLCLQLDNLDQGSSLINDGNYSSSYYSPINSDASVLLNNVKELASQLDQNLLYANSTGTGVPLQMTTVQIDSGNVGKVIFASDPTAYFESGDEIELTGFVTEPVTTALTITNVGLGNPASLAFSGTSFVTNGQSVLISGTNTSASLNGTHIATVTTAPNSITNTTTGGTTVTVTCNNHGFLDGDYVRISGSNSTPSIDGYWLISSVSTNNFNITVPSALTIASTLGTVTKTTVPVNVSSVTTGSGTASVTTGNDLKLFNNKFEISTVNPSVDLPSENSITFLIPSDTALKTYTATAVDSGSKLNSYKYRKITATGDSTYALPLDDLELSTPATSEQIGTINNTLYRISEKLKLERNATIPTNLLQLYITPFSMTSSANTQLKITIPTNIDDDYFVQIYRTNIFTATTIQTLGGIGGIPVTPNDEMRLVSEIFPTIQDLENGYIIFDDISPYELVQNNTNLYTNPQSGVGIAGANEPPPFAKDINRFKNVAFYANTRTRQRLTPFQLLGIEKIQENDKITIASINGSQTFTFILGKQEITDVVCNSSASISDGDYFNLYSQSGIYYAPYYNINNSSFIPSVPNDLYGNIANLIKIDVLSTDSKLQVAQKTLNTLNALIYDFTCSNLVKITSITPGTPTTTIQTEYNHNLIAGDNIVISGISQTSGTTLNASFSIVSAPSSNTFTISTASIPVITSYTDATTEINTVTITASNEGKCLPASDFNTGFVISQFQAGNGEDASLGQVLLSNLTSAAQAITQTAQSLVRVINKKSTIINAYYISSDTTAPGQINLEERGLSTNPFYISANTNDLGSSFNPDISPINIIDTDPSSCITGSGNIFTLTSPSHGLNNGDTIIICGSNSDPIIDGYYSVSNCTTNTFDITSDSAYISDGTKFTYSQTENSVFSQADTKPNRIYFSKPGEPEAVPLLNFYDISAEDKEILRIFPLRDTLFIFKQDGTYRISGEAAPFVQSLLDSSCIVIAPDSVAATNNIIYAWTSKGISPISETGAGAEVSRPIDTEVLRLSSSPFFNFSKVTWGVGYDSDSSYTVYTNSEITDEKATVAFRYCTLTNTWTNFTRSQTCGLNFSEQDVLYLGSGDSNIINKERKNFNRTDYADKDFSVDLLFGNLNYQTKTIILPSVSGINVGDILTQEQTVTIYNFNSLLQQLDVDPTVGLNQIVSSSGTSTTITITTSSPHYLSTNDYVSLSDTNSYPSLDGLYKVTYVNSTQFTIQISSPLLTQATTGKSKRNYEAMLSATYGDNMRTKIVQLAAYLDSDPTISFSDYSDRISSKSGEIISDSEDNPTIITTGILNPGPPPTYLNVPHELINGRIVTIFQTYPGTPQFPESIPSVTGTYSVTPIGNFGISDTFTINKNVTTEGGFGLSYSTAPNLNDFNDIKACYNEIISRLNTDSGVSFTTYKQITDVTLFEAVITHVNQASNKITLNLPLEWVQGPMRVYNAIQCELTYAPITFGDPLMQKQIFDATMMFRDKAMTKITASFSSDLKPEYTEIIMYGQGNGIFGNYSEPGFGYGFFGGSSNAAPFRTLIPAQNQRCRFLNMKITHNTGRESWALYGTTLTGNVGISTRAYR